MRCASKNCKNVRDICPRSLLCPSCDAWWKDYNKRQSLQARQSVARDNSRNRNRDLNVQGDISYSENLPVHQVAVAPPAFQPQNEPSITLQPPPPIDISALHDCYNQHKDDTNESPLIRNMFGLMSHLYSKQSESDNLKSEIQLVNSRLDAIESKIGGPDEISDKLGLAVQKVPYPNKGFTD